jgi:hypothetical protein
MQPVVDVRLPVDIEVRYCGSLHKEVSYRVALVVQKKRVALEEG